jgi:biotin operon repressor
MPLPPEELHPMANTATRLITLILLLQRQPNQKAGALAKKLGVSVRSLHRYIAMLDEMGIPVYSERGPGGGFSLLRGYKLPPLIFTPEEAVTVCLGAELTKEMWGKLYEEAAQGAIAKIENVLPDEQRDEVAWARRAWRTASRSSRPCAGPSAPRNESGFDTRAASRPRRWTARWTHTRWPTAGAGGTWWDFADCGTKSAPSASTASSP